MAVFPPFLPGPEMILLLFLRFAEDNLDWFVKPFFKSFLHPRPSREGIPPGPQRPPSGAGGEAVNLDELWQSRLDARQRAAGPRWVLEKTVSQRDTRKTRLLLVKTQRWALNRFTWSHEKRGHFFWSTTENMLWGLKGTRRGGLLILLFHLCFDYSLTLEVMIAGTKIMIRAAGASSWKLFKISIKAGRNRLTHRRWERPRVKRPSRLSGTLNVIKSFKERVTAHFTLCWITQKTNLMDSWKCADRAFKHQISFCNLSAFSQD